jgi:hypothetical protein
MYGGGDAKPEMVMQAPTRLDSVTLARGRARKWLRVFQQLVRVLDRLEQKQESLLASSLVFLVQRALGSLETTEPATPIAGSEGEVFEAGENEGAELLSAIAIARDERPRRDLRDDPANDELEVLLTLSGAMVENAEACRFDDLAVPADALVREYRLLNQSSADTVQTALVFPSLFRGRWAALVQSAAQKTDPMRRLSFELSIVKVIRALYAMAIGYRKAADFEESRSEHDAWLAYSIGESTLKSVRR